MNWKKEIIEECERYNEDTSSLVYTISDEELNKEFDSGYGMGEGCMFTAWSTNRVYFPVVYDGSEWVGSAPRNPCEESCRHVGGQ